MSALTDPLTILAALIGVMVLAFLLAAIAAHAHPMPDRLVAPTQPAASRPLTAAETRQAAEQAIRQAVRLTSAPTTAELAYEEAAKATDARAMAADWRAVGDDLRRALGGERVAECPKCRRRIWHGSQTSKIPRCPECKVGMVEVPIDRAYGPHRDV